MDYPIIESEIYKVKNHNAKQLDHFRILYSMVLLGDPYYVQNLENCQRVVDDD